MEVLSQSSGSRDAPSMKNGVDLLKNRNDNVKLGPFDGRLAAHIEQERTPFFITTNSRYIPALPPSSPLQLILRRDMRYGPDDPTLWPQFYSDEFCHLGSIPRRPTTQKGKDAIGMLWWDPQLSDFISPSSGQTITRGLGKLHHKPCSRLAQLVGELLQEYAVYAETITPVTKVTPLLGQLAQSLRLGLERLQTLPSTFNRMVIEVTNLQRCYLEMTGVLKYMTVYKPRIENPNSEPGLPDDCMGVFTSDPIVAQHFRIARLPYWFIRPLSAFQNDNILRVVEPLEAAAMIELEAAPGYPSIPVNSNLDQRLRSLHLCTKSAPWYQNPFTVPPAPSGVSVPPPPQAIAGPSRSSHAPSAAERGNRKQHRPTPYAQAHVAKQARGPPKKERDKFLPFESPNMPCIIDSWANALSKIDRSQPPACGAQIQNLYIFPEPALLVSAEDEGRRNMMLHHYQLVRDALIYRLGNSDVSHHLLTVQQWRDVLQGKVTRQGKSGSRAEARSGVIENVLGPAMRACGLDQYHQFPVDPSQAPRTTRHRAQEMVWEVGEVNFRYELLALDARASGLDRPDDCRQCFPGNILIGFDIKESKMGFAALASKDRLPYLLCLARLMLDWRPRPRPDQIALALDQSPPEWDAASIKDLEEAVATYYTQCFYDLFGRAAVVPLRIVHEFGT